MRSPDCTVRVSGSTTTLPNIPSGQSARSASGKCAAISDACTAARRLVPDATATVSNIWRSTPAYTTSISNMQLLGSLTERVDQGIGGLIEQRPQRRPHNGPRIIEGQIQADLAGLLGQHLEYPDTMQLGERPFLQIHFNGFARHQDIACDKVLAEPSRGRYLHGRPANIAKGAAEPREGRTKELRVLFGIRPAGSSTQRDRSRHAR